MLEALITSKTRLRVLMRLFLNPEQEVYIRKLASEFGISSNLASEEFHSLSKAGYLVSRKDGRQIFYRANTKHPLFPEIHSMVRKAIGVKHIEEIILKKLGNVEQAFVVDDYAEGRDTGVIDLVIVGDINRSNLNNLVEKTERLIKRKIRSLVLDRKEFLNLKTYFADRPKLTLYPLGFESLEIPSGEITLNA